MMACAMKFSAGAVRNQLRHNRRTIEHSSNRDIDPERLEHDYVLSPDRGMTEYDYFLQRKSELYCYCLLYTSPSPRDMRSSRMPSSA